ncbi:MAK3 [Symbiodinium necroappetens]|uniref:MAK3 protein n=1 Tax=Symbiodinium necroappetens TaxID=1628268 RepID=A0A812NDQ2_9DINO|nr:MAK3 [Symbiodinium necroappetens]|mmetsp:Transcript_69937/g.166983  ORF Transcript_69937/g.166983 Transcript_69937/m.166983 type:complete len:376 (-) Transcript_69937:8-1135(-)
MMNLDLKIPKQAERLRLASAGLPVKQLREALHPCICDGCGALLLGTRFKCIECSDFDLCAGCLRSGCPAQRASPEWSHRDTHTLVVLRRITDTAQLPRAFCLAESLQTAEEVPGGVRHAPKVPCIRGCQPRDDKSVAICTRCGSLACSGCFLCCSGAPLLRFSAKGEEALPTLLRRAKAALKHLPFEGPPVVLREPDTEIQLGGPVQIGTSGRLAPPDGCEVRAMTAADMQAVLSVESICFMEPYSLETFEGLICLSSSRSLVALLEGSFAGYLILDLGRCRRRGQAAYIVSLAVLPTCRGRGVAESLMKQAISDARNSGAGSVELHVHTQNHGAQRLYRRCGFHVVCSIEGYYGEVDALQSGDAFLMSTGPLHQ